MAPNIQKQAGEETLRVRELSNSRTEAVKGGAWSRLPGAGFIDLEWEADTSS